MPIPSQDMQQPTVGIVIPCYNQKQYIFNALDSIFAQDYKNKIICLVDDGSTDGLYEEINQYIPSLQTYRGIPFKYIRNELPTGPSAARNRGFEVLAPSCHVFSVLDADDTYLPGKLTKCVNVWSQHPQAIGLVYHDVIINNILDGTSIHEFRKPFSHAALEQEDIICNCPLISKEAIATCGGYDTQLRTCEDWDLWLRITSRFIAIHIAEPLSTYTVTGQNTSVTVPKEVWQRNWQIIGQRIQQAHQYA